LELVAGCRGGGGERVLREIEKKQKKEVKREIRAERKKKTKPTTTRKGMTLLKAEESGRTYQSSVKLRKRRQGTGGGGKWKKALPRGVASPSG